MRAQPNGTGRLGAMPADRRWVLAVGGVALLLALWAIYTRFQSAQVQAPVRESTAIVTSVKTAQASLGQIAAGISYTGDIKAAAQVSVLPKASGRIERLAVDVGSRVKKGEVIAQLDSATAKAQLDQAKANLDAAKAKYATMQAGSREEQIAQAKANLDAARQKLSAMQQGSRDEQIAQAQAALDAAQAKADTIKKGATDADRQAAQSAVDSAKAALLQAQARLDTVKQGPTQTEWGAALGAVDAARANLKAAQAKLDDLKAGPKQADLLAAQAAVDQAKAALDAANDKKSYADDHNSVAQLATLGVTSAGQADNAATAAQQAYDAAVAKLDLLKSMPLPADLQAAQSAVDAAQANLMAAEYRVDQMKRGPTPQDLQQAQAAVDAAQATLAQAQARLKQINDGPTQEDITQADAAVTQAQQALALAQKPFRDQDIAQAQDAVAAAEAQYKLALNPFTQNDLDMAKAGVDQAQAALDLAQIAFNETTVTSPMDGVVADKLQSEGALVGPSVPIVSIISSDVELLLGVEESQIGQIKEGQKAEISVAAFPGTVFPASVASISPAADPRGRTFQVKVRPDDQDGRLRQGMFAQVKIITQQKDNALTVPKEALLNRSGQTVLFVLKGDAVQMRPVKVGITGNSTAEILSGLDPGEEVVVSGQNDLHDGDKVRKG